MNLPKVLITNEVPDEHLEPLQGIAEVIMGPGGNALMPRDEVIALGPDLDAIINQHELTVDEELLAGCPKLKVIANVAMGSNNMDYDAMRKRGVIGTNVPAAFTEATADHALALLLALVRNIKELDGYVRGGTWPDDGFQPGRWDGILLSGKVMGVIGYGKIGRAVANRAKAFGMSVLFSDPSCSEESGATDLPTLIQEADVITLHIPLTEETKGLFGTETISKMKRGAILLNLARGGIVDESALADALTSGHLAGAGLDVFENEPIVHPKLLDAPNCIFTPHVGGGTHASRKQARLTACENVAAVLRGDPPPNPVTHLS